MAFESVEITIIIIFSVLVTISVALLLRAKRPKEKTKLFREWSENGDAILNWLRAHRDELNRDIKAMISHPEFQKLLWKDFELYSKLIILDPNLKEDPMANEGRIFYGSLIRTESKKPS